MEFLAALIAVILVQLWGSGAPLHRDGWFLQWCRWCGRLPGLNNAPTLLMLVALSVPVFALLVVYYGIADQWWGLPKLAMLVVILLYSLGRGDFRSALEGYTQAWRAGNTENAQRILRGFDSALPDVPNTLPALHAQARARTLYRGFERMFVVLFWFALAGPALALAYRLAFLYRHRAITAQNGDSAKKIKTADSDDLAQNSGAANGSLALALADQLLAVFEWLPARALGISLAAVSNVHEGVRAWVNLLWQHGNAASAYLAAVYESVSAVENLVALSANDPGDVLGGSSNEAVFIAKADDELRQIQVLLNRALVFWLAALALVQVVL